MKQCSNTLNVFIKERYFITLLLNVPTPEMYQECYYFNYQGQDPVCCGDSELTTRNTLPSWVQDKIQPLPTQGDDE